MDEETRSELDKQLDFIKSRASKDEVNHLRSAFYWVIGTAALAALTAVGAGFSSYSSYGSADRRIAVVEIQLTGINARQVENNEILKEIERLLRDKHNAID
ncbi:MAG: hypothetical protein C4542_08220 [Dehalococcoidia bacterium]|nr:MAG: hypothetical protein C4542_08220 [Dehalococcoidia bacterium]